MDTRIATVAARSTRSAARALMATVSTTRAVWVTVVDTVAVISITSTTERHQAGNGGGKTAHHAGGHINQRHAPTGAAV